MPAYESVQLQELSLDVTVDQVAEELKFIKRRSEVKVSAALGQKFNALLAANEVLVTDAWTTRRTRVLLMSSPAMLSAMLGKI